MDYSLIKDVFGGWSPLLDSLIGGTLSYFGVIVLLRLSGKRTLSKWNAFDFVVTIALGSILASALVTPSIAVAQAMVSIGLLVSFQLMLTWLSVRSGVIQALVKAKPRLLLFKGEFLEQAIKNERVAKGEILAAIRLGGGSSIENTDAVVLETNGSFSVIENLDVAQASALIDVEGFRKQALS